MPSFVLPALPAAARLEVLQVDAAPIVRHFLDRLDLPGMFDRHLADLPGRQPDLPSSTILGVLVTNLLLSREPLYGISSWASLFVPQHLGLLPGQAALLNDDRCGRAVDHLFRSDRASLLTAVILRVIKIFQLALAEVHQDTTTVTVSGEYAGQPAAIETNRPARITRGYNKDHRPDFKQLVYDRTVTFDGAVPIRCNILDGNTADDTVHQQNWLALRKLLGHSNFLYVADCKLCSEDNLKVIADNQGRFLTVVPRSHKENRRFRLWVQHNDVPWMSLFTRKNPRGKNKPKVSYSGYEDPKGSDDGYRILWYLSSQKQQHDKEARRKKLNKTRKRLEGLRPRGRAGEFSSKQAAQEAIDRVLAKAKVRDWLKVEIVEQVQEEKVQRGRGRPGPNTQYQTVTHKSYTIRVEENKEAVALAQRSDGIFPLITNDKDLSLKEALQKYKYQPYAEKRHEQMKSVFSVMPVWLKNPKRVESLLWLYHLVDLVQALLEREVRQKMKEAGLASLPLYAEDRQSKAPTAQMVLKAYQGHRCYRLLDDTGAEVMCLHDPVSEVAQTLLTLLGIDRSAYGLPRLDPHLSHGLPSPPSSSTSPLSQIP
jgi:transposase